MILFLHFQFIIVKIIYLYIDPYHAKCNGKIFCLKFTHPLMCPLPFFFFSLCLSFLLVSLTFIFFLSQESLVRKREETRKEKLKSLARINSRRCTAYPIYGGDLVDTISFVNKSKHSVEHYKHKWGGYLNSEHHIFSEEDPALHLHTTRALVQSIKTAAERMLAMMDIIKRYDQNMCVNLFFLFYS